jgi:alpha-galactosidase/6-phospho-beta-glucosidase family protein
MLDRKYGDRPWKPRLARTTGSTLETLHFSYHIMRRMRKQFGIIPCSNELEGPIHIYPDEFPIVAEKKPMSAAAAKAAEEAGRKARDVADREFRAHLDRDLDAAFWAKSGPENRHFAPAIGDTTAVVLRAIGTNEPQWLGASLPNRGAVCGFKDRAVLEYSFTLDRKGVHPDPDLEVPDAFHGVVSSLACHQTLLGDAIATRDPRTFADALYAYPVQQGTNKATALWRELLKIHDAELPTELRKAKDYFTHNEKEIVR